MAKQKRIEQDKVRKMMGETHKAKPFRTRVNEYRVEWVWEGDVMVPKRVRKA